MMPHDFRLLPNGVVNNRLHAPGIHRAKQSGEVLRLLRFFFAKSAREKSGRKPGEPCADKLPSFFGKNGCR